MIYNGQQPVTLIGIQRVTQLGPKWNGKGAIIVGTLILVIAAVGFAINCAWLQYTHDGDKGGAPGTSGVGIWGALLFFLPTGLLSIMAGVRKQYSLVVATLVMSIISILCSVIPMLAIASTGIDAAQNKKYDITFNFFSIFDSRPTEDNTTYHLAFGGVFIACAIVLGVLLLTASILSCNGLSGLRTVENSYPMATGMPYPMTTHASYPTGMTISYPATHLNTTMYNTSSPQYPDEQKPTYDAPPAYGHY